MLWKQRAVFDGYRGNLRLCDQRSSTERAGFSLVEQKMEGVGRCSRARERAERGCVRSSGTEFNAEYLCAVLAPRSGRSA